MKQSASTNHGFTLLELLVVVAILAILFGLGSSAISSAMDKGKMAAEVGAAKSLIAAYHAAATDNNGRYLPAYDASASNVVNAVGKPVTMAESKARYPWRLAPYFGYALKGTLLVGDNEAQFMKQMEIRSRNNAMYDYGVSIFPVLGINQSYVGGRVKNAKGEYDKNITADDCIKTIAEADQSVIVFVSAGTEGIDGYEYVKGPGAPGGSWSSAPWTEKSSPGEYGNVHPRHNGKAVAAFLDGSVRVLGVKELADKRLWSRAAAIQGKQ